MKVLCVLTNGFEEIEAIGTIAILKRSGIDVDIFSLNSDEAKGRFGVNINQLQQFKNINKEQYDLLFIAGGPEYEELETSNKFKDLIKYFYDNNKYIAAIYAAPTILGHLNMLKGLNYTCFSSMNEDFGGNFIDTYCVKDKNIITGKSAAATIEFAFLIVETLLGEAKAHQVKESIYYYNK